MLCRKNQATLTPTEKARFVAAVLALKADGTYDRFVAIHDGAHLAAHRGPAFLPWHREYLRRFELELQRIDSTVTLPYWDWSVDSSPTSTIWNPDFMGGDGRPGDRRVMTGPFAFDAGQWTLLHGGIQDLRREFAAGAPTLPTPADVTATLAAVPYDVAPWSTSSPSGFRNRAEGWIAGPQMHNRVHVWVGGSMLPLTSPNDPVFYLNHAFEDKLWADWQRMHPGEGYLPVSGAAPGHNLHDAMQPWAAAGEIVRPSTVLDHHSLGYAYDNESECGGKSVPKIEKLETKEGKFEKFELKELKREKFELKELKREKIEKREIKEFKQEKLERWEDKGFEKPPRLEGKDLVEGPGGKDLVEGPVGKDFTEGPPIDFGQDLIQPVQTQPGNGLEASVQRLENTVNVLRHFIDSQLRPDLSDGALQREQDVQDGDGNPSTPAHDDSDGHEH